MTKVDHIERARGYIAKGDGFYLKAADEIVAAQKDDPGLSTREIARRLDRSARWVEQLVRARTSAEPVPQGDLKIPWDRGSHATTAEIEAGARKLIAEKPAEVATEIAQAMEDPEIAQAVTAESSQKALDNVGIASSTESYLRRKANEKPPPDAASHQLGGMGPGAMADKIHNETMEPALDSVYNMIEKAYGRYERHGFRMALTELGEFDRERERLIQCGQRIAFFLEQLDAAEAAKASNEAEGIAS